VSFEGSWSRRKFAAVAAVASSYSRILGANERVRVANVGCGRRNLLRDLIEVKDSAGLEIAAVCDTWRQKRERAAATVKEFTGREPFATSRFAEVLARKDIDAVVIGTPDHQHCAQLIEAVQAGKDVYVEKPLAMNMRELVRAYDAVKKSGRVVQMGTQMRSYPQSGGLKSWLASGALGRMLKVEQARNSYMPYWMNYGGPAFFDEKPTEADVDWKAFLMDRRARPFNPDMYQNWYGHREFSHGPHTNLMVHFIDLVHFTTGVNCPVRANAMGGTFRWKNQFNAPDSVEVAFEYPEGFLVRYSTVMGNGAGNYAKWFGTRGTVDGKRLSPREPWVASGEGSGEPDALKVETAVPQVESVHHMKNFVDCIRSRRETIAPIEAGYAHSVAVIMAEEALTTGRRMTYDHARRAVFPA
jgi:predicted dehydrogenase